jgi:hypothetical protein
MITKWTLTSKWSSARHYNRFRVENHVMPLSEELHRLDATMPNYKTQILYKESVFMKV